MTKKTGERGPIYNVELIDVLPIAGSMMQAMPSHDDLVYANANKNNSRLAAGYEVLLAQWYDLQKIIADNLHKRRCFQCGSEAWHKYNYGEFVRCTHCHSMDTRKMT
jgi:hypothetical protein